MTTPVLRKDQLRKVVGSGTAVETRKAAHPMVGKETCTSQLELKKKFEVIQNSQCELVADNVPQASNLGSMTLKNPPTSSNMTKQRRKSHVDATSQKRPLPS